MATSSHHRLSSNTSWATRAVAFLGAAVILATAVEQFVIMRSNPNISWLGAMATTSASLSIGAAATSGAANTTVDLSWHAPNATRINNISSAINGTGIYGFIYNNSYPTDVPYGTYDWCNMPHVRKTEYPKVSGYSLQYVELVHRHHKRTVYASNAFPVESYPWNCNDEGLFYYGKPMPGNNSASSYWQGYQSSVNPFVPPGFQGTCQFPQITAEGLDDSWQHGRDLYEVYHDMLGFLPDVPDETVRFRVTQNTITSQVAGMVINGMFSTEDDIPLLVQPSGVDSLEPTYTCPSASATTSSMQASAPWTGHLADAQPLFAALDAISGVAADDAGFHASMDHYYDNLSARQCHAKPLPCRLVDGANTTDCVSQALADAVYRLGNWEYSFLYRDAPASLAASSAGYGVWVAELAANMRARVDAAGGEAGGDATAPAVIYRHNVAHDGSISRLLSVLQIDVMVWPGMGSEVAFEMYTKDGDRTSGASTSDFYVRVLWGGQVMRSSSPTLGLMDMVPLDTVLAYFDGLVGENASLVMGKCGY